MQGHALTHLSIRVPWHDNRWDGRVCSDPANNHSCLALRAIAETRNDATEPRLHDELISDLEEDQKPPCVKERATFLSSREINRRGVMDYSRWSSAHKHIRPTFVRVPAWGATLLPYRWLLRENAYKIAKELNLDVSQEREPTDLPFLKRTDWVQDYENQRALLDGFAERCVPDKSLTFFYAKRTPLADDDRRVIVGVGMLVHKGDVSQYDYEPAAPKTHLRSMIWERAIQHSIRPDRVNPGHYVGGIILPYHAILERAAADDSLDTAEFLACAPEEAREQYSYASEHVTHGVAITTLLTASLRWSAPPAT